MRFGALSVGSGSARRWATPALVLLTAACDQGPSGPVPPVGTRAVVDRPDESPGHRIHLVYAVCSRGCTERGFDTTGVLAASFERVQDWLAAQTGGRRLRVDTFQGRPDITFFEVEGANYDLQFMRSGLVNLIWEQMEPTGFRAGRKRYLIYYDGLNARAASARFGLEAAAVYMGYAPFAFGDSLPTSRELAALHEILHMLGYVDSDAPNHDDSNPAHVTDGRRDLMWGVEPWVPEVPDLGEDDYFGANLPSGVANFRDSPWLMAAPRAESTPAQSSQR